jgi:hypothetical protein
MKLNKQKQTLTLSKQSISKLTNALSQKVNGGNLPTNFTASIADTCKCSFPPKCGSDKML